MQTKMLEGSLYKLIVKLSIPVIIGHVLMFFYNIADTIFISYIDRTSETLMSGIGLIFPLFFLYIAIGNGIFTGVSSLVARSIGAKNEAVLSRVADSAILLSLILAVLTTSMALWLCDPLLNVLAGSEISEESLGYAREYFLFISPGLSMFLFQMAFAGILQGEGKPKYMGIAMTLSTMLNLVLDPIFIFVLGWGVRGAAAASSIAMGTALLFIVSVFIRQKSGLRIHWNIFKARFSVIAEILRIGVPQTASMIVLSLSFMVLNRVVGSISETAMSSYVIYGRMNEIILVPSYGIGNAAMTLVGQSFGSGNYRRVLEAVKKCLVSILIASCTAAVMLNLFAPLLFHLFSDVPEIVSFCIFQARLLGTGSIGIAFGIVIGSAFQGTGRALPGFVLTLSKVLILMPLGWVLVLVFGHGFGVFIGASAAVHFLFLFIPLIWILTYTEKLAHKGPAFV